MVDGGFVQSVADSTDVPGLVPQGSRPHACHNPIGYLDPRKDEIDRPAYRAHGSVAFVCVEERDQVAVPEDIGDKRGRALEDEHADRTVSCTTQVDPEVAGAIHHVVGVQMPTSAGSLGAPAKEPM